MTDTAIDQSALYTLADAARVLRCHPGTVKAWVDAGKLAGTRLSDGSRVVMGAALAAEAKRRQAQHQSLSPA